MNKKEVLYYFLIMFFGLVLVYANHFDNSFHFDDFHTISNNIYIRNLSNWKIFFTDATTFSSLPTNQSYRPISTLSLAIDYFIGGGLNPFYFHLSTFIWYIIQLSLMYFLFLRIFSFSSENKNVNRLISFIGVSFYGFHTPNAETLNYVIARSDLFTALFSVMALVIYSYFPNKRKYYFYLIPVIIGVLAKPPTVMFLPILFIYILLFENKSELKLFSFANIISNLKYIIPTVLCIVFLVLFISKMETSTFSAGAKDVWLYRFTQPFIILIYLKTFLFPTHLSADTDIFAANNYFDNRIYLGIILLIAFISLAFYLSKNIKTRPIAFGMFWFLFALFPTSWIALSEALNDHRTFFPYVGLVISLIWSLYLFYKKLIIKYSQNLINIIFSFLILITISLNAYGVYNRNKVWDNEFELWKDVTIKSPKNGRGLMNFGLKFMEVGNYEEANNYFLKALEYNPNYSNLQTNLGIVNNALGKKSDAENYFKKAIEFSTGTQSSYLFYGRWLYNEGRFQEAEIIFEKGLSISKMDIEIRHRLLDTYNKLNKIDKLKSFANETKVLLPGDSLANYYLNSEINNSSKSTTNGSKVADLINQSLGYYNSKQFDKCIESCLAIIKIDNKNPIAYNNLCSAYNSIGAFKDGKLAGEMAVKLDPNNQLAKNNLAWSNKNIK